MFGYKTKGKEYYINDGKLEFEGEYLFDKKYNGKGYDHDGNIIYELLNGKGKVKEYDFDGNPKFEGEYLNCLKNGKIKEYNSKVLIFEGEYINGIRNGKGKQYDENYGTLVFEGEYLNGKRNGKGKEYTIFTILLVVVN